MGPKDSKQRRVPGNTPDRKTSDPRMPGEESEDIRKGAKQEDQLEKLHPESGDEKTAGKIGSQPVKNPGEEDSEAESRPG